MNAIMACIGGRAPPGKISASLAQDLVGLTQLAVLPLQRLELGGHVRGQARLAPAVSLGLANPLMQRLRSAADLAGNRDQRCPTRCMLMLMIQNHPHRAGSHLRRELVRCLACHGSTFSRVGASGKPGAVHLLLHGPSWPFDRWVSPGTALARP